MCAQHKTVLAVLAQIAVVDPIRVLNGHTVVTNWPVLSIELAHRIIALINLDIIPVISTGEQQGAHHRVSISALVNHISVALMNIACVHVEHHLVVKERSGVACVEVITVIAVVGNNTF